jgi:class 3 adenylate cyclase
VDERPVTRYAKSGDGAIIAYQVTGEGPVDILFGSGLAIPVDLMWEEPSFVRFARRLSSFSRTVWYETRGWGASGGEMTGVRADQIVDDDLAALLGAVGVDQVVLMATSTYAPNVIRYAVERPEHIRALVLISTFAYYLREGDYRWGFAPDVLDRAVEATGQGWGTGAWLNTVAPSKSADDAFVGWWARCERLGIPRDQLVPQTYRVLQRDVRALLPFLTVPTLVLHRHGDRFIRAGAGRYLGEHIPGAKYVELPGDDHLFFVGDTDALLDEIEDFLTGRRQEPEGDVVLAAVLFTDIVDSTGQAGRMGHRKWRAVSEDHDAMIRATLKRHRGLEVKTMGDGFLATFDATTRAVRAATDIVDAAHRLGIQVRAGVHTGEIEVRPHDVVGLAVSITKRICDRARPGEVLVSSTVKAHAVGSGIPFTEQGTHALKGVPDAWELFAVGDS